MSAREILSHLLIGAGSIWIFTRPLPLPEEEIYGFSPMARDFLNVTRDLHHAIESAATEVEATKKADQLQLALED